MATAYAALVSLMNLLVRVQRRNCPVDFEKLQIQSLLDKLRIKLNPVLCSKFMKGIVANLNNFSELIACIDDGFLHQDLKETIQGMDLIIKEADQVVKQKKCEKDQLPRSSLQVSSSVPAPSGTLKFAGFEEEVDWFLEKLAAHKSSQEIIPVVGMGGIGKSTLAVSVYNHPYVRSRFDVKGWVTISQLYDIGTLIRSLLHDFAVSVTDDELLGDKLYKHLFSRRYFIVLDDIWDSVAWNLINKLLSENNNGSRILLTTRILNVARKVGSCSPYQMKLLDDNKSWDLLSKMVFGHESSPPELKQCGKDIAKSCKGLPLALTVIGGILKLSANTSEYWAYVADNISSIRSQEDDEHCLKVLSLSYNELPIHLKPCFLSMASFPEDYEIRISEVTKLWAADGFRKPNGDDTTLEEVALKNLKGLINRNLIMVKSRNSRGRVKCLTVHDLVRDLCIRQAQMERFLNVDNGIGAKESQRRLVLHRSSIDTVFSPIKHRNRLVRSFVSLAPMTNWIDEPPAMPLLSLLRVFFSPQRGSTLDNIMQLANLQYINSSDEIFFLYDRNASLIFPLSVLWNLDTLIVDNTDLHIPTAIWDLPHIQHLIFSGGYVNFPDPPAAHIDSVLSNLQTLKKVRIRNNKLLHMIPNIKDLGIECSEEELPHGFWNLVHCSKLETLYLYGEITFDPYELNSVQLLFPNSLKKLTLAGCYIPWERMAIVGSLPNLEALKLVISEAFIGKEWNSNEGEFQRLKLLSIAGCSDLESWTVDDCSHFPRLEHLRLRGMRNLKEVPQVFGESTTLKSIQLKMCKYSAVISAKKILDEQQSNGDSDLTVEAIELREGNQEQKTELESLASDRFLFKWDLTSSEEV